MWFSMLRLCLFYLSIQPLLGTFIFPDTDPAPGAEKQFGTINITDFSGRTRRDVTGHVPESMACEITIDGDPVKLVLRHNHRLDDNMMVHVMRNGKLTTETVTSLQRVAFFQDPGNGAAFGVVCEHTGPGVCAYKLEGVLSKGNNWYLVYPRHGHQAHRGGESPYVIAKINQTLDFGIYDYIVPADARLRPTALPGRQKRAVTKTNYNVELLMVADFSVYQFWFEKTAASVLSERRSLTLAKIRRFYAFVLNAVDLCYKSIDESDLSLRVVFAGLCITEEPESSPWTESIRVANADDPDRPLVNSSVALDSFRNWTQNHQSELPPSDHAMLFTAYDLRWKEGKSIAGLAYVGTICSESSNSIAENRFNFLSVTVVAHELGHSLSALHDGQNNSCSLEDYFIMAASPRYVDNRHLFSSCSVDYFRAQIHQLNTSGNNCLLSESPSFDPTALTPLLETLPGQMYSADTQCAYGVDSRSFFCRGFYNITSYPNICTFMYCDLPDESNRCRKIGAATGTSCGQNKWCVNGECVFDTNAPSVLDACPQGDRPGVIESANLTCADLVLSAPHLCYIEYYNIRCCNSCQSIRTNIEGCEYGDKVSGCTRENCENNLSVCCKSCYVPTTTMEVPTTSATVPSTTATVPTTTTTVPTTTATAPTTTTTVPTLSFQSTQTTSRPATAFNCPGNGFFADPENCRNYYLCFLGSMYSYTCDGTKGFDEVVGDCTPSGCEVKTTPATPDIACKTFGEAHPDPSDCTRYYVCYYGIPYSVACGNLLAYNEANQRCERGNFESCLERMIAQEATTASSTTEQATESVSGTTTAMPLTTETPQAVTCPNGVANLTDYGNCRMYYICVWGIGYHQACPAGTGFNPTTRQCTPDGCDYSRDTPLPTETPHSCSGEYGLEADARSCLSFYMCFMWMPKKLDCDPYTAFNGVTRNCEAESYQPCLDSLVTTLPSGSTTTARPTVPDAIHGPGTPDPACPWAEVGMFEYIGNEQKFCWCDIVNHTFGCRAYRCDLSLIYDPVTQLCKKSTRPSVY